jgi:hypothetical protein
MRGRRRSNHRTASHPLLIIAFGRLRKATTQAAKGLLRKRSRERARPTRKTSQLISELCAPIDSDTKFEQM